MPRGGKREGAGRPPGRRGAKTLARVEIVANAIKTGKTPLELMLRYMEEYDKEGTPEAKKKAADLAKDAAPYLHPRLSSAEVKSERTVKYVARLPAKVTSHEEWLLRYGHLRDEHPPGEVARQQREQDKTVAFDLTGEGQKRH